MNDPKLQDDDTLTSMHSLQSARRLAADGD